MRIESIIGTSHRMLARTRGFELVETSKETISDLLGIASLCHEVNAFLMS